MLNLLTIVLSIGARDCLLLRSLRVPSLKFPLIYLPSIPPLGFVKELMQDNHAEVRKRIALSSEKYKQRVDLHRRSVEFQPGDSVLIRLRPERFPKGSFQKLHHRRGGPFKILQRLGPNAYHIELPPEFHLSPVFNVEDLTAFSGNIEEPTTNNLSPNIPIAAKPRDEIEDILDD